MGTVKIDLLHQILLLYYRSLPYVDNRVNALVQYHNKSREEATFSGGPQINISMLLFRSLLAVSTQYSCMCII